MIPASAAEAALCCFQSDAFTFSECSSLVCLTLCSLQTVLLTEHHLPFSTFSFLCLQPVLNVSHIKSVAVTFGTCLELFFFCHLVPFYSHSCDQGLKHSPDNRRTHSETLLQTFCKTICDSCNTSMKRFGQTHASSYWISLGGLHVFQQTAFLSDMILLSAHTDTQDRMVSTSSSSSCCCPAAADIFSSLSVCSVHHQPVCLHNMGDGCQTYFMYCCFYFRPSGSIWTDWSWLRSPVCRCAVWLLIVEWQQLGSFPSQPIRVWRRPRVKAEERWRLTHPGHSGSVLTHCRSNSNSLSDSDSVLFRSSSDSFTVLFWLVEGNWERLVSQQTNTSHCLSSLNSLTVEPLCTHSVCSRYVTLHQGCQWL